MIYLDIHYVFLYSIYSLEDYSVREKFCHNYSLESFGLF